MDMKDIMKRAAAGTAMAGALGFGILGASSGIASAKPGNPGPHPNPPGPGVSAPAHPGHVGGQVGFGDDVNGSVGDDNGGVGDDNGGTGGDVDGHLGGGWRGNWNGGNVDSAWLPGMAPGHNPFGPPGQVSQMANLTFRSALNVGNGLTIPAGTILPNPFLNIRPGQWASVNLASAFNATAPTAISWLAPGALTPQPLTWNPTGGVNGQGAWGVPVNGAFTPYPIQFPAPMTG